MHCIFYSLNLLFAIITESKKILIMHSLSNYNNSPAKPIIKAAKQK